MRLHRLYSAFVVVVALAASGCGSSSSSSAGADPAQVIPASSIFYAEAVVRPEGAQKENVDKLLSRFGQGGDVTGKLRAVIDEGLRSEDKNASYDQDIAPWLGQRIGVGVTDVASDDTGYIIAAVVKDAGKAEAFLKSQTKGAKAGSYKDTDYVNDGDTTFGLVGDFLVAAGSPAELKQAVDAQHGVSLGDSDRFKTAIDKLPQERLGAAYVDLKRLPALIAAQPDAGPAAGAIARKLFGSGPPFTAALTATADSATIESRFGAKGLGGLGLLGPLGTTGKSTPLVRDIPEGAFAVFGAAGVGASLKGTLETFAGAFGGAALTGQLEQQTGVNLDRDIFSWLGDVAVFARGTSVRDINGAIVISVTDEGAARAAIPRLVTAAKRSGAPVQGASVAGADQAFSVPVPQAPGPVVLAQKGDRVVVALGEATAAEALNPTKTIDDSGLYGRAKDAIDGVDPSLILDAPPILELIGPYADNEPGYAKAKPYLDMLDLIATGSEKDGDELRSVFTVKVK